MTEIKLLALDLDGTLFDSQKVVSEENKQALRAARDKGVKVVITTGRPLKAVEDLLDELDLISDEDYIITFNGGLVQKTNGKILDKSQLTRDQLRRLHEALEPLGLPFDVLSDGIVYSLPSQGNHSHYPQANPKLTFVELDSFDEIPKDVIYNKVVSVHKAAGLQQLIDHLGFLPEQVMAMGDEENDLSMLKWAGLGVAMANAVPKVKAIANHTTTRTNEESGVAETIEEYILKA